MVAERYLIQFVEFLRIKRSDARGQAVLLICWHKRSKLVNSFQPNVTKQILPRTRVVDSTNDSTNSFQTQ